MLINSNFILRGKYQLKNAITLITQSQMEPIRILSRETVYFNILI